jgi:hypothetical protein
VIGQRLIAGALAGGAVVAAGGCGSNDDYQNRLRPPALFVVTAAIAPDRVSVSPHKFGAGPISLIVTNQTDATQQVTLQSSAAGSALQQSGPINPQDTATLQADVPQGTYQLKVAGKGIKPAVLLVGKKRPSSQNTLLLP